MKTQCIKVTLQENPLNVLKGCSALLSELDKSSSENIYIDYAISLIGDLTTDAVSQLDEQYTAKQENPSCLVLNLYN